MPGEEIWVLIGTLAAMITLSGLFSQIIRGFRTKRLRDLSYFMIIFLGIGMFLWLLYGLHRRDPVIIGANAIGVSSSMLLAFMKWKYDKTLTT